MNINNLNELLNFVDDDFDTPDLEGPPALTCKKCGYQIDLNPAHDLNMTVFLAIAHLRAHENAAE